MAKLNVNHRVLALTSLSFGVLCWPTIPVATTTLALVSIRLSMMLITKSGFVKEMMIFWCQAVASMFLLRILETVPLNGTFTHLLRRLVWMIVVRAALTKLERCGFK
jgi:hypothetical protein